MIDKTITGANNGKGQPIRTFNENLETDVWRLVMGFIDQEKRVDGNEAYVIRDMSELVMGILDFYEQVYSKKNKGK